MDEILIEEKKYVSSKRAAKITGYAKDYVGQLCREGRVPARLVGRSWYVLETAIKDHRFGDHQAEQEVQVDAPVSEPKISMWKASHYEASSVDILPSVNRLLHPFGKLLPDGSPDAGDAGDTENQASEDNQAESSGSVQSLQDSWRAWFDHVGVRTEQGAPAATVTTENQDTEKEENDRSIEEKKEDSDSVDVPIHVVYEPLPRELLPTDSKDSLYNKQYNQTTSIQKEGGGKRLLRRTIKILGTLLTILSVILAVIGSGYFDTYLISVRQVDVISGVTLYNK